MDLMNFDTRKQPEKEFRIQNSGVEGVNCDRR